MKSTRTVLACAALILMLAMGVRQTMGLFLPQMTVANGWTRDEFAFAIALQNLLWGAFVSPRRGESCHTCSSPDRGQAGGRRRAA